MNFSFSEDVLQKLKLQQRRLQNEKNPQSALMANSFAIKTHYLAERNSPKQITYNEIIHDGQTKRKGRYRLRNSRQPTLKVVESKSKQKQRGGSLLGLKQLMKQQMQRYSIKKRYESVMQKYADNEVAQKLRLDLLFLPTTAKVPHKNRYRPNKLTAKTDNVISINGRNISQFQQSVLQNIVKQSKIMEQVEYPQAPKRTAGYELKYKRNYLNRKIDMIVPMAAVQVQVQPIHVHKQQQFVPLTGWQ